MDENKKYCPTCKEVLPADLFYLTPSRLKDKYRSVWDCFSRECKVCSRAGARRRYQKNYVSAPGDDEQRRQWREDKKRLYHQNRHALMARASKNRSEKLKRSPAWANKKKIERVYQLAAWAFKYTDESLEVDHIIPLQGKNISGLHVENNLQILTRSENRGKCNSFAL